jgi:nicotinate phosphoribosyltransferase
VGTSLGVGAGSVERDIEGAALGGVYKEVFYSDERGPHPKIKVAGEKSTWPGIKEVYRLGSFASDIIQLASEPKPPDSERLLKPVVLDGEIVPGSLPPLSEIWEFAQGNLRRLPEEFLKLTPPRPYPVRISDGIRAMREHALAEQVRAALGREPAAHDEAEAQAVPAVEGA